MAATMGNNRGDTNKLKLQPNSASQKQRLKTKHGVKKKERGRKEGTGREGKSKGKKGREGEKKEGRKGGREEGGKDGRREGEKKVKKGEMEEDKKKKVIKANLYCL